MNFKVRLEKIKLMVFDIDGVLTDGSVHCFNSGEQVRVMYIKDGYALQLAVKKNLRILILSGGQSEAARKRLNGLGINEVMMGIEHKLPVLQSYLIEHDIKPEECLYMGDDIPDLECMKLVAVPVCPSDAAHDIKQISLYVSPYAGGKGCVRDIIEQVLRLKGYWLDADAHTW